MVLFEFAAGGGDRQPVTDQTDMSGTRSRLSHSRLRGDNVVFGLRCAGLVHSHRGKHKMTEAVCDTLCVVVECTSGGLYKAVFGLRELIPSG